MVINFSLLNGMIQRDVWPPGIERDRRAEFLKTRRTGQIVDLPRCFPGLATPGNFHGRSTSTRVL